MMVKNFVSVCIGIVGMYFCWLMWQVVWHQPLIINYYTTQLFASVSTLLTALFFICLIGMQRNCEHM